MPIALHRPFRRLLGAHALLCLGALIGSGGCVALKAQTAPRTILLRGERLAESKRLLASGDVSLKTAFDALLETARAALAAPTLSVMQKQRTPSSGDKHDYMSMAPYFWPNPATPNGLPFINRDGEMNPESRKDHDGLRLQQTIARARTRSLAWYLTGDARYAEDAGDVLVEHEIPVMHDEQAAQGGPFSLPHVARQCGECRRVHPDLARKRGAPLRARPVRRSVVDAGRGFDLPTRRRRAGIVCSSWCCAGRADDARHAGEHAPSASQACCVAAYFLLGLQYFSRSRNAMLFGTLVIGSGVSSSR